MAVYIPKRAIVFYAVVCSTVCAVPDIIELPDTTGLQTADSVPVRSTTYQTFHSHLFFDTISDSGFILFKSGIESYNNSDFPSALSCFRRAARSSDCVAPLAYEYIGNLERQQNRPVNALLAYRSVLDYEIPQRYQLYIYEKIDTTIRVNQIDTTEIPWFIEWLHSVPRHLPPRDTLMETLDSLIEHRQWDILRQRLLYFTQEPYHKLTCPVLSRFLSSSFPDSLLSTQECMQVSEAAYHCGSNVSASDWLHIALKRNDFKKVIDKKRYLYYRARLNYALGNYTAAVSWFTRYKKAFGETPSVVLYLARTYRKLGKSSDASRMYDRHLRLYPKHPNSHDILWYRAWQHEEGGDFKRAISLFRSMYRRHPGSRMAAKARFRCGLLYYRQKNYDSAYHIWESYARSYPSSYHVPRFRYWSAKALIKKNRPGKAEEILRSIAGESPLDYYSYRARAMLTLLTDSLHKVSIDTLYDLERAQHWLDSLSVNNKPLSKRDSLFLLRGTMAISMDIVPQAEFFFEPIEVTYPENLGLQFDLAVLYALHGHPTLSFRIARFLSRRIPGEVQDSMPLAIYFLLYPFSFNEMIESAASTFSVDDCFIRAVIRQESIFDPIIGSPAGAIGLMQIMPATGKAIANTLDDPYTPDSLYNPEKNVRYGAFYLRKLLKEFDGSKVLALSGYNGGPHNAIKWLKRNHDLDFDLFVESISFSETRTYVKKVLANYWTYRHLAEIVDKNI
jgi:tetratricopeptide (TPR) repeat protein